MNGLYTMWNFMCGVQLFDGAWFHQIHFKSRTLLNNYYGLFIFCRSFQAKMMDYNKVELQVYCLHNSYKYKLIILLCEIYCDSVVLSQRYYLHKCLLRSHMKKMHMRSSGKMHIISKSWKNIEVNLTNRVYKMFYF